MSFTVSETKTIVKQQIFIVVWFSLKGIGHPELFTKDTKPLLFSDSTPTFYGIAPVGATINLTLYQDQTDEVGNTNKHQLTSLSTHANTSSEWGINLDTPLTTGNYYLTIQATDSSDNFAILKDIPLLLSNQTIASNSDDTKVLGVSDEAVDATVTPTKQVTPTTPPTTPTPTPSPKQFSLPFTNWCW